VDSIYIDTTRMRNHADTIAEEKRYARALCDRLQRARNIALPEDMPRIARLCELAESYARYFTRMDETVERMCDTSEQINRQIFDQLESIAREVSRIL